MLQVNFRKRCSMFCFEFARNVFCNNLFSYFGNSHYYVLIIFKNVNISFYHDATINLRVIPPSFFSSSDVGLRHVRRSKVNAQVPLYRWTDTLHHIQKHKRRWLKNTLSNTYSNRNRRTDYPNVGEFSTVEQKKRQKYEIVYSSRWRQCR